MEKRCSKCNKMLNVSCFFKHKRHRDGLNTICKVCHQDDRRPRRKAQNETRRREKAAYLEAHKDEIAEQQRLALEKKMEQRRERDRIFYQKNLEKKRAKSRKYNSEHREECKIAFKRWYLSNIEQQGIRTKKWKDNNRERINARTRAKGKKPLTLKGKLCARMSTGVRRMLKTGKGGESWQKLLGYSFMQLKRHIEKQFTEGMSWDAFMRGEIHIDHIIPIRAFQFSTPGDIQFKACWALKNLRPLWKADNLKKNGKLLEPFQQYLL